MREQAQKWLAEWFAGRGKIGGGTRDGVADTDYFGAGWLSSMEVVEFVTEIEGHFGIQFSDRDLQDARFVTISGLSELILERSTQPTQSR
ncbi:MAG: acyl carrier protein [Candidatus Sulfotelmatobacter sp.]